MSEISNIPTPPKDILARKRASAYFGLFSFMLVSGILSIPLVLSGILGLQNPNLIVALAFTNICFLLVIYIFTRWTDNLAGYKETLGLGRFSIKQFGFGMFVGAAGFGLLDLLGFILGKFDVELENSETSDQIINAGGASRWVVLILLVPIVVPFIEELFFRGFILGNALEGFEVEKRSLRGKAWIGILISSLCFAFAHIQGFSTATDFFIPGWIFFMAVVYGIMRTKFDSIWSTFAAHMTYNGTTALIVIMSSIRI